MAKKKLLIGFDTETCNGKTREDGTLDLSGSLVYDIGWAVTDKNGNVLLTRSFIVKEIFFGEWALMQSAYYAEKIPQYLTDMGAGKRKALPFLEIRKIFLEDCVDYGVDTGFAHNTPFDVRALNNTVRHVTNGNVRYFFPYGFNLWDTLAMSRSVLTNKKSYRAFCEENGYMTAHSVPRPRLTAEIIYRFITGEDEFAESHTGLEDVLIEKDILAYCFRQKKKMDKGVFKKK